MAREIEFNSSNSNTMVSFNSGASSFKTGSPDKCQTNMAILRRELVPKRLDGIEEIEIEELSDNSLLYIDNGGVNATINAKEVISEHVDEKIAEHNINNNAHTYIQNRISSEASARIAADTNLQTNINTEATIRSTADTTLQTNINNEANTRLANDTTLQNNITAETNRATSAEATLTSNLATEVSNRQTGDTNTLSAAKSYTDNSLVNYYNKTEVDTKDTNVLNSAKGYTDQKDSATRTWADSKFLTEHQSLANYDTKAEVNTKISNATNDMATKTWVGNQGYLTEHQSLAAYSTTQQMNAAIEAHHDSTKQDTINDLSTIRSNATSGAGAASTISTYGNIVTHNISEFATAAQGTKADSALQQGDILNVTSSTATNKALSANMGKELQDQINNLKTRGRFLSVWDCTTGLATTEPTVNPYTYKTGDFFIVGTVGTTNYKPNGPTYDKTVPSTTVETNSVQVNDTYYYDSSVWHLLHTETPIVAFSTLAGSPYDNTNLSTALNSKQAIIDNSNKLSSDLVDDTNHTNKFVTASEKTSIGTALQPNDNITELNNNAGFITNSVNNLVNYSTTTAMNTAIANHHDSTKQNVIDSSHKLSSDLVDDTNKTNKFVTSNEKTLIGTAIQPNDNISELNNDAGYLTEHQSLANYSTTTQMNTAIANHHDSTKQNVIDSSHKLSADLISDGTTNKTVTQTEKATWNNKQDALTTQTAYSAKGSGTKVPQITTNTLGQVTGITEVDITKTTLGDLGIVASAAELNYVSGVTSSIQTQLNNKPSINSSNNYVPYRSSSTEFANSSLMYNVNAMAFTGKVHIGSTDPANYSSKGRLSIYDNTPSTQVSSLALLNYGGGGGCGVAIDMYNTHANSGIPSGRIGILDNNSYSAYMELACKKSGAAGNPLSPICTLVPIPASGTSTVTMGVGGDYKGRAVLDIKRNDSDFKPCASETRLTGSGTTYRTANATGTNHKLMAWLTYSVGDILSASSSGSNPVFITNITEYSNYQLEITTSATLGTLSSSTVYFKKAFFKVQDGDGSVKMFIEPNGKMGIGKITPNYELDVVGTINASTDVKINGTSVEKISNKVTTISSASTDTQYPSAKCVYDIVGNIEAALDAIRGV